MKLLFVLAAFYSNILKIDKMLQFWEKKFSSKTKMARHSSAKG